MSVINKMLRDLDQRQSPASGAADPLRRDTNSVALPPVRRPASALRWAMVVLPVAAAVAGAFVWWSLQPAPLPVASPALALQPAPTLALAPALAASAAIAEPTLAASAALEPALTLPVTAAPAAAPSAATTVASSSAPAATVQARTRPEPVAPSPPVATKPELTAPPVAAMQKPAALPASVAPASTPPTAAAATKPPAPQAEASSAATRQQQAGREALALAQAQWASGARDAAISGLHEAVAAAERGTQGGAGAAGVLVPMVRELARMELAEGRAAAVWDLLLRLEPLLANQPELWALRANAAQRLGRHQDSVLAYTTALQSRPSEQRWLLGAAVSLAALGQTGPAAEMADKARAVGPVSREVLAYLRQQGVPLTDRP